MTAPGRVKLQIVAYTPTAFFACKHCELALSEAGVGREVHQEQVRSGLPPDLVEEYGRISDWVGELVARHGEQVAVDLIDVASVRGLWKSLRHRLRRYPAVIVDGRTFAGAELPAAAEAVARALAGAARA
jgi:hypothetical protein